MISSKSGRLVIRSKNCSGVSTCFAVTPSVGAFERGLTWRPFAGAPDPGAPFTEPLVVRNGCVRAGFGMLVPPGLSIAGRAGYHRPAMTITLVQETKAPATHIRLEPVL